MTAIALFFQKIKAYFILLVGAVGVLLGYTLARRADEAREAKEAADNERFIRKVKERQNEIQNESLNEQSKIEGMTDEEITDQLNRRSGHLH